MTAFDSEWWLDKLGKELDGRANAVRLYQRYYAGDHPMAYVSAAFRQAYGSTYLRYADNFAGLVVDALVERLTVQGFRWDNAAGSRKAWRLWQANRMDAESKKAIRVSCVTGQSSLIVGPDPKGGETPIIRVQKPDQVAVGYGDDPLVREVALKRWKTADSRELATLFYADRIEKYEREDRGWSRRAVAGEPWPLPHDLGAVPVVPLVSSPDLDNDGRSDIHDVIPLQDQLNTLQRFALVVAEETAFRQRWVKGVDIPVDPETNKPIELFKTRVGQTWHAADKDAGFGDFDQSDPTGLLAQMEKVVQHMATKTRTPAHYLLGMSGTFPSGESLKATENGLVAKARDRAVDLGEPLEEVMALAFRASGDMTRGHYASGETEWKDPEYRTEAEHVDALLKMASLGVPPEVLWARWGATPQEVERWKAMGAEKPVTPVPSLPEPAVEEAA